MQAALAACRAALARPGAVIALTGAGVAGTSAQTRLPWHVVQLASAAGATLADVDIEDHSFGDIAARSGGVIRGPAAAALNAIAGALISRQRAGRSPRDWAGCARCHLRAAIRYSAASRRTASPSRSRTSQRS